MGMTIEEICYRLQAMATMCIFQDAVGHDLSHKEIGLYNQAKDEAVSIIKKYQKIERIINDIPYLDKDEYKVASVREILKQE